MTDADTPHLAEPPSSGVTGVLARISFAVGALGLLTAMGADAIAVTGRHLGIPVIGSIEIVQASVVIGASAAMVGATLSGAHAAVHIVLEHVPGGVRHALQAIADLFSAAFFAALAGGSIWVAYELSNAQEISDVLGLPIQPLRLFWCANAVLVCVLFLLRVVKPPKTEPRHEP